MNELQAGSNIGKDEIMDNQHRMMRGYREASADQIKMFNRVSQLGEEIEGVINQVRGFNALVEVGKAEGSSSTAAGPLNEIKLQLRTRAPERWVAMAETDFQVALMKLKRAVMQPTTF